MEPKEQSRFEIYERQAERARQAMSEWPVWMRTKVTVSPPQLIVTTRPYGQVADHG